LKHLSSSRDVQGSESGSALNGVAGFRIQEGKNDPQKKKKSKEIVCFEMLDVLFCGLKTSPVAWASFMEA
jgi:hypothetical protein